MADLVARQDVHPATCSICSRRSHGIAYGTKLGDPVWWVCDFCNPYLAMKVADMNTMKLNNFEVMAIEHASQATIEDVFDAILEKIWGVGVRSLEDLNGDRYKIVLAEVAASPDYRKAIGKVLIEYSNKIRKDIQTQAVPF